MPKVRAVCHLTWWMTSLVPYDVPVNLAYASADFKYEQSIARGRYIY
jgi:hypothetical protein